MLPMKNMSPTITDHSFLQRNGLVTVPRDRIDGGVVPQFVGEDLVTVGQMDAFVRESHFPASGQFGLTPNGRLALVPKGASLAGLDHLHEAPMYPEGLTSWNDIIAGDPNQPVRVSLHVAVAYCAWLTSVTGYATGLLDATSWGVVAMKGGNLGSYPWPNYYSREGQVYSSLIRPGFRFRDHLMPVGFVPNQDDWFGVKKLSRFYSLEYRNEDQIKRYWSLFEQLAFPGGHYLFEWVNGAFLIDKVTGQSSPPHEWNQQNNASLELSEIYFAKCAGTDRSNMRWRYDIEDREYVSPNEEACFRIGIWGANSMRDGEG